MSIRPGAGGAQARLAPKENHEAIVNALDKTRSQPGFILQQEVNISNPGPPRRGEGPGLEFMLTCKSLILESRSQPVFD